MKEQKMNWLFFLNNRGEVENTGNPGNEAGSFQDAIVEGLEAAEVPETPVTPEKPEIEVEGYKGADRRAKAYEGERRREADKANDDPEHEMDFELKEGAGKHKFKLSDLKELAKWAHDNRQDLAAWRDLRVSLGKDENFAKMFNGIIKNSFNEKGEFNGEFITKQLNALEGKSEKIDTAIDNKTDQIEKIEQLLKSDDIDPDSVQYQVLKGNLEALKASRGQLQTALDKINQFEQKLGNIEKGQTDFLKGQENAAFNQEKQRVSELFRKTFNENLESSKYVFANDKERTRFERDVRDIVAGSIKEGMNDESYSKIIRDASKAVYDETSKLREHWQNEYIRNKGLESKGQETDSSAELDTMKQQLAALEQKGEGQTQEAEQLRQKIKQAQELAEDPLKGKSMGEAVAEMFTGS